MPTRTGKARAAATAQPLEAAEVPVTRAMLGSLRTELFERMDQFRDQARADNVRLDAKIDAVRAEVQEVKAEVQEVKAEIHGVKAGIARIEVLVEEQNTRNKIVLDGITAILGRQNQVEERVSYVEETVRKLVSR